MGIGAKSSFWRRWLFHWFRSSYFRRKVVFNDETFEAYISPGSSLKHLDPRRVAIDPVHQRFIREWIDPDAIVWDIGTNLGLFALPAAIQAKNGAVIGFEPDVDLVANVLRSMRLPANAKLKVSVFPLAISNVDGTANFQISKYSRAMNKLEGVGQWHEAQVVIEELRSVGTMRIDTLAKSLSPPSVIKIDVEGAEIQVLEGGENTIAQYRPVILIEGPKELWDQMGTFFKRHNYVMLDGASEDRNPLERPVWDTVAIPREKFSRPKL